MNSGYFSTSATRSNIWAALYGTRTDRCTLCIDYRKWLEWQDFTGSARPGPKTKQNPQDPKQEGFMSIIDNRKATHDYFIEDRYEAGLVLQGWEVKAIRDGRVQLKESYVIVRDGELYLLGMHVSPLPTASTHIHPDAMRTRKLLLKAEEISKLIGKVEQRGYTLVPLNLHYKNGRIKLDFALGRGKKLFDKRDTAREKDWAREKERIMKHDTRAPRKSKDD
ncbi:SsrA-binding protein SmpB [Achromobacter spanius]|uniref:SsrA-binding protein SmpB n=1 Tax=Achromobacter spanius TaxID=217203 RepID=UPI0032083C1C